MYRVRADSVEAGYPNFRVRANVEFGGGLNCLVGPNGAGKSTLIRAIVGLLRPIKGAIYVDNVNVYKLSSRNRARMLTALLPDVPTLHFMRAIDVVLLGEYPRSYLLYRAMDEAMAVMSRLGIADLAERRFAELSSGQRQRVLIARALMQRPKVLLVDEPTVHLDIDAKVQVMSLLRELTREITVVVSIHEPDLMYRFCSTVYLMWGGDIRYVGPPEAAPLSEVYSVPLSPAMGTLELPAPRGDPLLHLVPGAGTCAPVMRRLAAEGVPFSVGVAHLGDLGYFVAEAMGAPLAGEQPYTEIGADSLNAALSMAEQARAVIHCGCPFSHINAGNLELLRKAVNMGKPVYSLSRDPPVGEPLRIEDLAGLVRKLR